MGCGLDDLFNRVNNNECKGFNIDLEDVINARNELLPPLENETNIVCDLNDTSWFEKIPYENGVILVALGVFYYFEEKAVIEFLRKVKELGNVEVIFDTVSKFGMKQTRKYMKQLGKDDALMYFYVEDINDLLKKLGNEVQLLDNHDYYEWVTDKSKFNFITRISMKISDKFHMVKMIHLKLYEED